MKKNITKFNIIVTIFHIQFTFHDYYYQYKCDDDMWQEL